MKDTKWKKKKKKKNQWLENWTKLITLNTGDEVIAYRKEMQYIDDSEIGLKSIDCIRYRFDTSFGSKQ